MQPMKCKISIQELHPDANYLILEYEAHPSIPHGALLHYLGRNKDYRQVAEFIVDEIHRESTADGNSFLVNFKNANPLVWGWLIAGWRFPYAFLLTSDSYDGMAQVIAEAKRAALEAIGQFRYERSALRTDHTSR